MPEQQSSSPEERAVETEPTAVVRADLSTHDTERRGPLAEAQLVSLKGKQYRVAGECISTSENPDALAEELREFYAQNAPHAVNPQVGVVTAPDETILVLSGQVYEMYQLNSHIRRLLDYVHATMDDAHVDSDRQDLAIVRSKDQNAAAIEFKSYKKLYALSQELEAKFFKAIQDCPFYSRSKEDDSVHDFKGLYRDTRRNFSLARFKGILPYLKKKAGKVLTSITSAIGFSGKREKEKMTISRRLKKSLSEEVLEKRISQQLSNIEKAKSPIQKINLALVVVAESIDELRTRMSGLYAEETLVEKKFQDIPQHSPVGKLPVERPGRFSMSKAPMELALLPDIVVRDWKSGDMISYPLDQCADLQTCLELAVDNYRLTLKGRGGNDPKVPFRRYVNEIAEGRHCEVGLVREGKRVSFIAETDEGPAVFPLGMLTKDDGSYFIVTPDLEEVRRITRDRDTTLDDCMVSEQANSEGVIESDLLVFGDDRIVHVDYEFEQVAYAEPANKNPASWWSRFWNGKNNPHEFMRRLSKACDGFRDDLKECEFKNRSIYRKRVSTVGQQRWQENS